MSQISTETNILNGRVFKVNRSELVGRWDAYFNYALKISTLKTKYPTISISSAFKSYSGGTPSKANLSYWNGFVPWVSPKDFKALMLVDTEDHITEEAISNSATIIAHKGSLLMVVRSGVLAHTIPVAITTKPMAFNQDVKAFIQQADISTKFLAVYFQVYNDQLLPLIVKHSTTVQSINTVQLNTLKIPAPPSDLQEKIVHLYLDAVAEKKQKEQQAQTLLAGIDAYLLAALGISLPQQDNTLEGRIFTTTFKEVSGSRLDAYFYKNEYQLLIDRIKNVKSYRLKDIICFSSETWNQQDHFVGTFPYIEISEIDLWSGEIKNIKHISIAEAPSRAKMLIREGDIIVSTTRPTRGAIAHNQFQGIQIASTGFAVIREIKGNAITKDFLFHVLRLSSSLKQMGQRSTGGNYPAITQEELGNILIPYVDINQQEKIVMRINEIYSHAKQLQTEAAQILADAKAEVERMILGE
ncbi:restriction endonuclease subunit S [Methylobacter sp. G7]|uniref:restriction endonuclease subunit S n=1 Tax=Methylobacter sp. G7 TaxID=3230117 RepID=UPI003D80280D